MKLRGLIENLGVDIDTISVDSRKVREALLEDDNYSIKETPSILVIYDTGEFIVLTGHDLDRWFSELIENLQNLRNPPEETPIENVQTSEQTETTFIDSMNTGLVSPPLENLNIGAPSETPVAKEIKKEGPSPAELAKKMAEQRDQIDETIESGRPMVMER